jgi:intron-binding protein aquarius
LWPNFDADKSSVAHVVSILVMVNEKFRENVSAPWACFQEDEARFGRFFQRVLGLREERQLSTREEAVYLLFLINSFQSLENPMVRSECLKYATVSSNTHTTTRAPNDCSPCVCVWC